MNRENEEGNRALMVATIAGKVDLVRMLISRGSDVNAVNLNKDSSVMFAEHWK